MDNNSSLQQLNTKMYKNPVIKAIQSLIEDNVPIVGTLVAASRAAFEQRLSNMQEERKAVFLAELDKGGSITTEMLEMEEFIHSFLVVYRAAINTYQREKIRRFARILLTGIEENELATDKFEEFIHILNGVTETDLLVIRELSAYESKYLSISKPESKWDVVHILAETDWLQYVEYMEQAHNVRNEHVYSILNRLGSVGLYEINMGMNRSGRSRGRATLLYSEFAKWVQLEAEVGDSLPSDQ